MNTIQLECFVAVAEYLNFSKASRVLKITQPAVSHQIQSLEEELDVKLFNRTSKSVALTTEGLLFLADAHLILRTALSAKERLGRHEHFLFFELGCHNYMEMKLLPPVLKQLGEEFPLLRPSIRLIPFPSLLSQLESNQIQAALGVGDAPQKSSLYYYKELCLAPIACICAPGHPLARYKTLTKRQLHGSFVACSPHQVADSVFALQSNMLVNLPPEQRYLTESIESALSLVRAQFGYTLYPDFLPAREPDLCYIPVTNLPGVSFGVYCPFDHDEPVLKRFLALLSQYLQDSRPATGSSTSGPAGSGGA